MDLLTNGEFMMLNFKCVVSSLMLIIAFASSLSIAADNREIVRKADSLDLKKLENDSAGTIYKAGGMVLVVSTLGDKQAVVNGLAKYGISIKNAEPILARMNDPKVKLLVVGVTAATGAIAFVNEYASDSSENWIWLYRWWIALGAGMCGAVGFIAYRWKKKVP